MLDWNDLRLAVTIAELRTLTAAAARLGVHQGTASRRLAALEATLGVPLFLRGPQGYTPTPAGRKLLASAEEFATKLAALSREGIDEHREVRGVVRLAVTESIASELLVRTIPALKREHPALCVELVVSNLAADLSRGEADLAVRFLEPDASEFVRSKLGSIHYGIYATKSYLAHRAAPDDPRSLAGHDVIVPCGELARGPEARWLGDTLRGAGAAVRANSMSLLVRAAEESLGLAVLPDLMAFHRPKLVLVRALSEISARNVWIVYHRDARDVARVRATAKAVGAAIREKIRSANASRG